MWSGHEVSSVPQPVLIAVLLMLPSLFTTTRSVLMENRNDKTYIFASEFIFEFFARNIIILRFSFRG